MSVLEKAVLQEITSDESARPVGDPVPVQFNPTTLRLRLSNQTEGGTSRGRQARQYTGSSSTVLTVELVFDTADEGTTASPRSVRERTAIIEKYVLPKENGNEAPPKLRFQWGTFLLDGVVEDIDIDFDHFASNGTPLRAKVSLSLKEQDAKYQFLQAGPGANRRSGAPDSGQPAGAGPGTSEAGPINRSAVALAGELGPEFAARVGLDPAAWRGLDVDLSAGLTLEAGIEVGFHAELNVAAGLGLTAGISAGVDFSVEASLGLEVAGSATAAGFRLASAGGVESALQTVQIARSEHATTSALAAFPPPVEPRVPLPNTRTVHVGLPSPSVSPSPLRKPLAIAGLPSLSQQAAARSAAPPPRVDPRAVTFGSGVPLRTSITRAASTRTRVVVGRENADKPTVPEVSGNPSTPPWVRLPAADVGRASAGATQQERRPVTPCHCDGSTTSRKAPP